MSHKLTEGGPKPFKRRRSKPIPANAKTCTVNGQPAMRFKDHRGMATWAPVCPNRPDRIIIEAEQYGQFWQGDGKGTRGAVVLAGAFTAIQADQPGEIFQIRLAMAQKIAHTLHNACV